GSFGVILSLTVETENRFLLEAHTKRMRLTRALRNAMNTLEFDGLALPRPGERPYHFDVVINPHDKDGKVLVTTMYKRRYGPYDPPVFDDDGVTLGDDILGFLSRVIDALPEVITDAAIPGLITRVLNDRYPEFSDEYGTLGEVFGATTTRGKIASTAIGIPAARATDALDIVLDLNERKGPFPGALGMRFVKGTAATLGFTRFPKTCVLEIDGINGKNAREFYKEVWKAFDASDIEYTQHWGKMHDLTRTRVRRMYGDERVDAWIRAREKLLRPATREVFTSPLLRRAGLA
ncbi:MAG: FAD-binding protein, partial [Planctomycetota bacterium]